MLDFRVCGFRVCGFLGFSVRVWRWRDRPRRGWRERETEQRGRRESAVRLCGSACTRSPRVKKRSQASEDRSLFAANARSYRCILFSRDREKEGKQKGKKKRRLKHDVIYR